MHPVCYQIQISGIHPVGYQIQITEMHPVGCRIQISGMHPVSYWIRSRSNVLFLIRITFLSKIPFGRLTGKL